MTDLEKRAEEYADAHAVIHTKDVYIEIQDAYITGAKKETALLSNHILDLQKTNGALTDRVNEATEIIKEYLECAAWKVSDCPSFANICEMAEAFINKE